MTFLFPPKDPLLGICRSSEVLREYHAQLPCATNRETKAQRWQATCLKSLSEVRTNKNKRQSILVEGRATRSSELGSAAGTPCGFEKVAGSLWSLSVKWEENERVSLLMESLVSLNSMHIMLPQNGRCIFFLTAIFNKRLSPLPNIHCTLHTYSFLLGS